MKLKKLVLLLSPLLAFALLFRNVCGINFDYLSISADDDVELMI